ncbi:MAG: nucleotidyl transferase AbiEii/AbiGii toxin family protein [Candidatus Aenigmatarchaeota archaeon]
MKEFIEAVSRKINARTDLIERDILLHQILLDLSKTKFANEFAFKGGSCLMKYYLGYFRFSIDLDFTFINQNIFSNLSKKEIRRRLSEKIDEIGNIFEDIAERRGLNFKCDKKNRRYVEFGGSNKFLTFKIWFNSRFIGETFIKIQINFIEKIIFPIRKVFLKSLLDESKELQFLFPDIYNEYTTKVRFNVYDIREIFCEKIRAILTRNGIKERDFIDVYLISKKFNIKYTDMRDKILEKTRFILKLYEKYRDNLKKNLRIFSIENFPFGSEDYLLLIKIDKKEFYQFVEEFIVYLKEIGTIV